MKKINYINIKEYIEGESGNECVVITNEKEFELQKKEQNKSNSATKLKIQCKCGNEFITFFTNFKSANKKQCDECGKNNWKEKYSIPYLKIKEYIEGKDGNGCELITTEDEYTDTNDKLILRCDCGNEFKTKFGNFKSKNKKQCNICGIGIRANKKNKTNEQFIKEVHELSGDEYIVLGQYINAREKIKIQHNKCKNSWDILPNSLLSGIGCPYCGGTMQKTHEIFKKEVYDIVGDEYTVLTNYINTNKKIQLRHNYNGCNNYVWNATPHSFLAGSRCPKCCGTAKLTNDEFVLRIRNLVGDEYTPLNQYKATNKKIMFKHNSDKCNNYEWGITPADFYNGKRCPKCAGNARKTTNIFKQEVSNLVKDEYDVLGEYVNDGTKILMSHKKCGNKYLAIPSSFLQGRRCPICNESKGEQKIRHLLEETNISFITQYMFDDLKDKDFLRFDFAVYEDKETNILQYLLEYDGEFHYNPIKMYKNEPDNTTKERLIKQQYHDRLKNEYCEVNNIKLVRIPYWEFDKIEQILINNC